MVFDFATESSFRNPIDVLVTKLRFGNEMQVLEPKSDQIGWQKLNFVYKTFVNEISLTKVLQTKFRSQKGFW